jgi:group I intron endonuclease
MAEYNGKNTYSNVGIVYKITNLANGKVYIGQTIQCDFSKKNIYCPRLFKHYRHLKKGKHKNKALQHDFNLYGEEFQYEIIRLCRPEALNFEEKLEITLHDSTNFLFGYNISPGNRSFNLRSGSLNQVRLEELMRASRVVKCGQCEQYEQTINNLETSNRSQTLLIEELRDHIRQLEQHPYLSIKEAEAVEAAFRSVSEGLDVLYSVMPKTEVVGVGTIEQNIRHFVKDYYPERIPANVITTVKSRLFSENYLEPNKANSPYYKLGERYNGISGASDEQ